MSAVSPQTFGVETTVKIGLVVAMGHLGRLLVGFFGTMEVPLLLVGEPLSENQAELNGDVSEVRVRHIWLKLSREEYGVYGSSKHEQQYALDKRNKGPVEHVEYGLGDILPDDFPARVRFRALKQQDTYHL